MAEFKTAEQYVVEKVESLEAELKAVEIEHKLELAKVNKELANAYQDLEEARELLDMFRDFIEVRKSDYFGKVICVDNIYEKDYPEAVADLMEYYDIRPQED